MVAEAIRNIRHPQGVSRAAIASYICEHHKKEQNPTFNAHLRKALKSGCEKGLFKVGKTEQRFKLGDNVKNLGKKKKKTVAKTTSAKKETSSRRKSVTKKKKTTKKSISKKGKKSRKSSKKSPKSKGKGRKTKTKRRMSTRKPKTPKASESAGK